MTGVVLVFAFLTASFAVRNSDFWLHLATGRLIAHGEYLFGVDPFAYTTDGVYWANQAWLFDLGLYGLYEVVGGPGLVVLKAIAVTALAWVLLHVRRVDGNRTLPAACTLLAILTMSPRLLLQPTCLSFLCLALTFWILWRPHRVDGSPDGKATTLLDQLWRYGPLLLLFAVWANLDSWFILGPGLAALFWLGERLEAPSRRVTPAWLPAVGLVACLLNPYVLRVFQLPPECWTPIWSSELSQDARFRTLFLSPWHLGDYLRPTAGLNVAGLAYFILLVLGVVSFGLNWRRMVGWRLVVWSAFALIGAWQVRTIPFFAAIAGPVTALNLQDAFARRVKDVGQPRGQRASRGFSLGMLLSGLALVVLAWPGWLQALPHEHRRVSWQVRVDPSLERVAHTLHRWRQEGQLIEGDRVFPLHADVAHYCAWFAPGERGFFDHRLQLFERSLPQYRAVCRGLFHTAIDDAGHAEWRGVFRAHGITVVVLYDPDPQRLFQVVHYVTQAPEEWSLLQVAGQALVFGWTGGRDKGAFGRLRFDPRRLAFDPRGAERQLPTAPGEGLLRAPKPRGYWDQFLQPATAVAWESHAATMYLRLFDDRVVPQQRQAVASYAAGLAGLTGGSTLPVQVITRLVNAEPFLPGLHWRPPELCLLAVRAARRALASNPDDKNAWLRLGQAYWMLHRATNERAAFGHSPLLDQLRHVQAATALENAVLLDPDLEAAHEALSLLYGEHMYLDMALHHRQDAFRLTQRGPRHGESHTDFDDRLAREEAALNRLERLVQDRKNEYSVRSRALSGDPLGRANLALELGLARTAVDHVLLQSQILAFGGEGARLELELLLMLGRVEAARNLLDEPELRENKDKLDRATVPAPRRLGYHPFYELPAYEWLRFLQTAARGDYDLAAGTLWEMLEQLDERHRRGWSRTQRAVSLLLTTELGLGTDLQDRCLRLVLHGERLELTRHVSEFAFLASQRADLRVLGALLAVEQGVPAAAIKLLEGALEAASEHRPAVDFAGRPLASAYWREIQALFRRD